MKTKKYFLLAIVALLVGFASCDKELDLTPHDGMTGEALFKDGRSFEYAVRGCYSIWKNNGFYGEDIGIHLVGDMLSDNLMFNPKGRQSYQNLFLWKFSSSVTYSSAYYHPYALASRANSILAHIDKLPAGPERDNFEGEALAMRGIAHFEVLRWFCQIPTQSAGAGASLGIYYQDTYEPAKKEGVRRAGTTVDGSYAKVVEDLEKALTKINGKNPEFRLTKQAVQGMLARVYLYMGNYAKVIEYADQCLTGAVQPAGLADWAGLWKDQNRAISALIRIPILDKDRVAIGNPYSQTNKQSGTRSEYVVRKSLYDLYKDTDCRKVSIKKGEYLGLEFLHVNKYMGRASGSLNVNDIKYLRIEEVLLAKAEAQYKNGDEGGALATLDKLRANRYAGYVSLGESGPSLWDAIMLERRLELAFEGDRFFTMKRLGMALVRDGNEKELASGDGNYEQGEIDIQPGDHRWQLAIPKEAIELNPELAKDQNPGY